MDTRRLIERVLDCADPMCFRIGNPGKDGAFLVPPDSIEPMTVLVNAAPELARQLDAALKEIERLKRLLRQINAIRPLWHPPPDRCDGCEEEDSALYEMGRLIDAALAPTAKEPQ